MRPRRARIDARRRSPLQFSAKNRYNQSMFRITDLVLLAVVFSSMAAGVIWPEESRFFGPLLPHLLMGLLFLAFLKVRPASVSATLHRYPFKLIKLVLVKLLVLPVAVYLLAAYLLPSYALGLLLLAGASTGLSAPFFSGLVGASIPLVLAMTVVTTMLLPLTLPLLVKLLVGAELHFDLVSMTGFMMTLIFAPLAAAALGRRLLPQLTGWIESRSYPISLALFAAMNLGAFGLYAPFLRQHQGEVIVSVLLAGALGLLMAGTGAWLFFAGPPGEKVAAAGALGWINNVLVIVLGTYLNDPLTSVVAALYLVPYYLLVIPLRHLLLFSERRAAPAAIKEISPQRE